MDTFLDIVGYHSVSQSTMSHGAGCYVRSFQTLLVISLLLAGPSLQCGPGRVRLKRPGSHKRTPLVFKQHVPSVSENTLGASGPPEGKITRHDEKFKDLAENYNPDIIFKDHEGSGADRRMSHVSLIYAEFTFL